MAIEKSMSENNEEMTIKITGEFNRDSLNDVRPMTDTLPEGLKVINFDLNEASHIESDATKYLLTLEKPTKAKDIKVIIRTESNQIKTTLRLMQIDKIFDVNT